MEVESVALPGVLLLKPRVFGNGRGIFLEAWNQRAFDHAQRAR